MTYPIRPCLGCGHCCLTAPCVVGATVYHLRSAIERCPALIWNGKRYLCQLPIKDERFIEVLGIGEGCCQPLNSWRKEIKERCQKQN